jgi:hypothetical protein
LKLSDFTALSVGLGAHPIDFAADMRLRGLTGARDEFHLAAIVQNLKTMALRLLGPPTDGVCASIA